MLHKLRGGKGRCKEETAGKEQVGLPVVPWGPCVGAKQRCKHKGLGKEEKTKWREKDQGAERAG